MWPGGWVPLLWMTALQTWRSSALSSAQLIAGLATPPINQAPSPISILVTPEHTQACQKPTERRSITPKTHWQERVRPIHSLILKFCSLWKGQRSNLLPSASRPHHLLLLPSTPSPTHTPQLHRLFLGFLLNN